MTSDRTTTTNGPKYGGKKSRLRKWIGSGLRYAVPMACSALLMVWLFHKINFKEMMGIIRHGVDYWWLLLMMLVTTLSHIVRGARWGIQLRGVGVDCRLSELSVSIFGNYSLNLIFPRAGEVWRCIFISRRNRVPVSTVVGTLVGDRLSDAVVVLALLGLTLCVARPELDRFITHYAIGHDIRDITSDPWVWTGVLTVIAIVWSILHFFKRYKAVQATDRSLARVGRGFMSLFTMRGRWNFLWLTFGIWICYYLQIYIAFNAFPFTRAMMAEHSTALGLIPGLVAFVFSSFSMAIPSNGGLGPWNLSVMFALMLFGISQTEAAAFAMLVWSAETLMLVILGVYSAVWIAATRPAAGDRTQTSK